MAWDGGSEEEPESKCGWAAILMWHASCTQQGRRLMYDVDEQSYPSAGLANAIDRSAGFFGNKHWKNAERGA